MKKFKATILGTILLMGSAATAGDLAKETTTNYDLFGTVEYAYYDAQSGEYMGSFIYEDASCESVCFYGVYVN